MDLIVHIARASAWAAAKRSDSYEPSTLSSEGFIHMSRPEHVHLPANALYSDTPDLVLLWVDPSRIEGEIRDELPRPGAPTPFPHLYGPLNPDAVVAELPLAPWKPGAFQLPPKPPGV